MRTAVELNSTAVLFFEEIAGLEAADYTLALTGSVRESAGSGKRGDCFGRSFLQDASRSTSGLDTTEEHGLLDPPLCAVQV